MKRILFALLIIIPIIFGIIIPSGCSSTTSEGEIEPILSYTQPKLWTYGNAFSKEVWAQGTITNTGNITAYKVTATITFYGKDEVILYEGDTKFPELTPGETWQYSVYYQGPNMRLSDLVNATVAISTGAAPREDPRVKITYE